MDLFGRHSTTVVVEATKGSNSNRWLWSSPTNKWFGLDMDGGRWGVAHGCNCRPILDAIASLLEAQRPDMAMVLIEMELNYQT